ncbi:MAG: 4-hydroxy-tetrahydrodipicolinate reductase [Bacillota bacterium]|jgi:4-hydroxy-tetrahydrodipicolinate reductase
MRVLLHGCNGKMGQVMTRVLDSEPDMEIVCGVDIMPSQTTPHYPVYESLEHVKESADIVIDFSHHTCLESLLLFGTTRTVPLVICTTGFDARQRQMIQEASKTVPILHSANMSLGINLLASLVSWAAPVLWDTFDIEIVEKHHNQKVDSPSGTALLIADAIDESLRASTTLKAASSPNYTYGRYSKTQKRQKGEIGIHAIRGGGIVGEHNVIFAGQGEVLEINHMALSRDVFAHGAVKGARFIICQKPGLYSMKDVVKASVF